MKLCGDDGSVTVNTAIAVLEHHNISVERDGEKITLVSGEKPTVYHGWGDFLPRRMIHCLHYGYEIPIEHFYHPHMIGIEPVTH